MPTGDLAGFDSWADVREAGEHDATIKRMVRLIDTYGTDAILDICASATSEADADVIVSTAHKAKGREWDAVRIAGDFIRSADNGEAAEPSPAELMLMYVAVTRAKLRLDDSALATIGAGI
jgi:superfamily I DNA/RNA helicase